MFLTTLMPWQKKIDATNAHMHEKLRYKEPRISAGARAALSSPVRCISYQSRVLPLVRVLVSTAAVDPDELSSCESYDEHSCVVFLLFFSLRPPTSFGRSEAAVRPLGVVTK